MKKYYKTIRLSLDNVHLLNIFSQEHYIEIGNIDYKIIKKLLTGATLKLEKVVDFNIQAIGLGSSKVSNPSLQANIPYLFFHNIHEENQSQQIILTYGLIDYATETDDELFAPLILIPIRLLYEEGFFYLFLDALPLANELLLNQFRKKDLNIPTERLESINDFMRFCLNVSRLTKTKLHLESYFTFAKTVLPQIVMNHERFSLNNNIIWPLGDHLYNPKGELIPFICPLSFRQRQAVERAYLGNSFGIVGPLATGKTTTLLAIAASALHLQKKVLYLSAQKKTLNSFYSDLKKYHLSHLAINLNSSFNNISSKQKINWLHEKENLDISLIRQDLNNIYKLIEDQNSINDRRIRNFRFGEVINKLLLLDDVNISQDIDNLSNIYRHEHDDILKALKGIENDLDKLPGFKASKFIHIPINHQIEYPNQVLTLLFQIHQKFLALLEIAKTLENNFNFQKIENYAKFKIVINDIRNLSWQKIPPSWKKKTSNNFKKAKTLYQNLKHDVYSIQELELYIDWDYQNIDNFNVNEAINTIYADYWNENNQDEIEKIITNHLFLLNQLRLGLHNIRIFNKAVTRLKNVLDWNFDENDYVVTKTIISLTDYLRNYKVFYKWLNISKYEEIRQALLEVIKQIKRHEFLESQYLRYFTSLSDLDNNIINLAKIERKGKVSPKFKGLIIEDFLNDLKELKDLNEELVYLKAQYKSLTGLEYLRSDDIISHFDACYSFIKNIENDNNRRSIIKFLTNLKVDQLGDYLQDLNNYVHSYQINEDIYKDVIVYFPQINCTKLNEKQKFIQDAFKYISKVYEVNYKMSQVLKNGDKNIRFSSYLLLAKRLSDLENLKVNIRSNTKYKESYGKLFLGEKTNVNELGSLIEAYEAYINIFTNYEAAVVSLEEGNTQAIYAAINQTDLLFDDLTQLFKTYSRLFKDGIGGFYYDSLTDTITRISSLIEAKNELIAYLDLTSHLQVLHKYKLFLLANLIINGEKKIVKLFEKKYFLYLYEEFLKQQKYDILNSHIDANLETLQKLEKTYYQANLHQLLEKDYNKNSLSRHQSLYQAYINKPNKLIFLASPEILNYHLDINAFDLVLIDDAQTLHANEYHQAIQGKQVIIAGEELLHYMNQTTLISRMRPDYLVYFHKRFTISPLQLSLQVPNIYTPFYQDKTKNQGIELFKEDIIEYIIELITNNSNLQINIFVKNISTKRQLYDEFAQKALNRGLKDEFIEEILLNNLSIIDLFSGYSHSSHLNILFLQDYYNINLEFIDIHRLSNLLFPQEKLIFYDPNNYLETANDYSFIKFLKTLITSPLNPFIHHPTTLTSIVSDYLASYNIKSIGSYYDISLIIEKNNKYYGIVIYCDIEKNRCDLLDTYRYYRETKDSEGLKVYFIFALDLYTKKELVLNNIIEDLSHES